MWLKPFPDEMMMECAGEPGVGFDSVGFSWPSRLRPTAPRAVVPRKSRRVNGMSLRESASTSLGKDSRRRCQPHRVGDLAQRRYAAEQMFRKRFLPTAARDGGTEWCWEPVS